MLRYPASFAEKRMMEIRKASCRKADIGFL
jgi:hypothetical protein